MKILFTQLGCIGDIVLLTPAFSAVKRHFHDCEIHVIAGRRNYSIIENNPNVSKIFIHDKKPLKLLKNIYLLCQSKYDYLIDPKDHYSREGSMLAKLTRAKVKIGFNSPNKKSSFDIGLDGALENSSLHTVERIFKALQPLGIDFPAKISLPELFIRKDSENYIKTLDLPPKFILINISAGNEKRLWTPGKWVETALGIRNSTQTPVVIINAPTESQQADEILKNAPFLIHVKTRSIHDVIALASRADLVITPDTSVVHIAAAFDKPTLVLFDDNSHNQVKFKPLSSNSAFIAGNVSGAGLNSIAASDVIQAAKKFL